MIGVQRPDSLDRIPFIGMVRLSSSFVQESSTQLLNVKMMSPFRAPFQSGGYIHYVVLRERKTVQDRDKIRRRCDANESFTPGRRRSLHWGPRQELFEIAHEIIIDEASTSLT